MKNSKKMQIELQPDNQDYEQIGEQIKQGFTSGVIDGEDDDGTQIRTAWSLEVNKFNNN